jgi:predicted permease
MVGMNAIFVKIIPIVLIFALGFVLKKINFLKREHGDLFLKLVFYVSFPALIIISITRIKISSDFIYLPVIAVLIIIITFFVSYFIAKLLHLKRASFGVFLIATMIMNIGFSLPFFIAAYGEEGLARASLFDLGNGLLTVTFVYYFACKYGTGKNDAKTLIKKFALSPPIWALIIAFILNLSNVSLSSIPSEFFQTIGNLTIPLIMLSLGIYFTPKIIKIAPVLSAIAIRMFFGLLLGFIFVKIFNIEGLTRTIILICSAAPIGYNTLTFSSMQNLDKEYAASIVSISIIIGIIFIPLLIILLS